MKSNCRSSRERGQVMVVVLLGLSFFLIGVLAFAVDLGYVWFHRQTAQNAADAACTAGAMDMLSTANGTTAGNFIAGTSLDCSATAPNTATNSPVPCWYASSNGYPSTGLTAGTPSNDVQVSFPSSLSTVQSCSGSPPPGICSAAPVTANPFLKVTLADRVQTFFMGLITRKRTFDVGATAVCGLVLAKSPVPITVLDPRSSDTSFNLAGTPKLSIYGGPQRAIQVNSGSATAVSGSGTIDLSQGGPNLTGSDIGVAGGPTSACCNFNGGSTGNWRSPVAPASDPYAQLPAPSAASLTAQSGPYQIISKTCMSNPSCSNNGCPDPNGCDEYQAGIYSNGILITNKTAIFDPGIYYLSNGFTMGVNSCVRPSTVVGDGTGGTIFYFADNSSLSIGANAGTCKTSFNTTSGNGSLANGAYCSSSRLPGNIPSAIADSVLLGPCTGAYGDPLGTDDPVGQQRGVLFFQNRATSAQPNWGGGGQFLLGGTMYFHQCITSGTDTGLNCSSSAYNDKLTLAGDVCSGGYIVGELIVDQLSAQDNTCVTIDLQSNATRYLLKATLLQ